MNKRFFHAVAILIGMIVGVGIFGVPYAVAKVGFILGILYIFVLGLILLLVHLLYGEVVLRTEEKHRLVGFAEMYLGKWGKAAAAFSQIFGFYGALVAYIIIGGQFLQIVLAPFFGGSPLIYQIAFFLFMSLFVLAGLKLISYIEFFMTALLLVTVVVILIFGLPYVWYPNLYIVNLKQIFFPYGVILFALAGGAAIPEMREILRGQEEKMKKAIILGTAIPIIVTALFAFVVIGISGHNTSPEAILGLKKVLGEKIIFLGAVFGFFAIATSFLVLGLNLKNIFRYDYKLGEFLAWLLACAVPFLIFIWGAPAFIAVIAFVGAVFGGLDGLLIVLIWHKAKKMGKRMSEYSLTVSKLVINLIMIIFVLGIIYKLIY